MVRRWCSIDAEGDSGEKGLIGVSFYSDVFQFYTQDRNEIIDTINWHIDRKYTFVAHNAKYDLAVIWWQLNLPCEAVYFNGRFNHGICYNPKTNKRSEIWDSFNLSGNVSLAKLGQSLGIPKYETPKFLLGKEPDGTEWKCEDHGINECIDCYTVRDAEIVYRYMEYYTETLANWGVLPQRRIGGAAISVWRALDRPGKVNVSYSKIRELGRQSYFGGRVETFKLGRIDTLYGADVTSMYPSVMLETPFPNPETMVYLTNRNPSDIDWNGEGVAECEVFVPNMYIPPLPYSDNGERKFPIGLMRGFWTLLELRYAQSLGCEIRKVYQIAYTKSVVYPFSVFIGTLWELRNQYLKVNDARSVTVKIILNSLYGRMGIGDDLIEEHMFAMEGNKGTRDYPGAEIRVVDDNVFVMTGRKIPSDYKYRNVVWAAQITAAARVKLHKFMLMQGNSMVYCDTDSVYATRPIIGIDSGLGKLDKPEEFEYGIFYAPKLYTLKPVGSSEYHKAKGVPQQLVEDFISGKEVLFKSPISPKRMFDLGEMSGKWIDIHRSRQLTPHRRQPTNPMIILDNHAFSDTLPPVIGVSTVDDSVFKELD